MYTISRDVTFSAAHKLDLSYDSPCKVLHGHNWKVRVWMRKKTLDDNGMVCDFSAMKGVIEALDHYDGCISKVICMNPTAENIAFWICEQLLYAFKVEVWETDSCYACYEEELNI